MTATYSPAKQNLPNASVININILQLLGLYFVDSEFKILVRSIDEITIYPMMS